MALVTLKQVMEETLWVAKMNNGCRYVGTYEQTEGYRNRSDCKDHDTVCWEGQPVHLQKFWRDYEAYCTEHNKFMIIQEFYPIWEEMNTSSGEEPLSPEMKSYLNRFAK